MANFPTNIWDGVYKSSTGLLDKQHEEFIEPHLLKSLSLDLEDIAAEIVALQTHVLSPTFITANGVTLNNGTSSDAVADLQTQLDGNVYSIVEATGVPGTDLEVDFTGVVKFTKIVIKANYNGATTHGIRVQLYNYTDTAWDTIHTINHGLDHEQHIVLVPDDSDYISSTNAIVRFYHSETGNTSHNFYVDWCALG